MAAVLMKYQCLMEKYKDYEPEEEELEEEGTSETEGKEE